MMIATGMALAGPVCVLDCGNQFDAHRVARLARRQSVELKKVLSHIQVSRAFTCYQVVALFEQLSHAMMPYMVFDLLATFYDENVSAGESGRLLKIVLHHLKRLRQSAPVVVSLGPLPRKEWSYMQQMVAEVADHVFIWEAPLATPPGKLF